MPLSVAAAQAFLAVQRSTRAIGSPQEHGDALNIAATALARLIPIYVENRRGRPRRVKVDPASDSFVRGATRLRHADGTLEASLCVARANLRAALACLRAAPLPLFAAAAPSPKGNRLLASLPDADYARLERELELVPLRAGEVLFSEHTQRRHVDFPICGVVSLLYITAEGAPAEIAVIGNEGAVGVALLLGATSTPRRAVVRAEGLAYRVKAPAILEEFHRGGAVQSVLLRYVQSLIDQMAQTAVCNRYHTIEQQLCRWLLLDLDRSGSNEVLATQDLISQMLGVRRSGVSEAASRLQRLGILRQSRGRIVVRDRRKLEALACECYAMLRIRGAAETPARLPAGTSA